MTAPTISAVPSDIGILPTPPQPASATGPRFADLLASNASALAAFALLPPPGSDTLSAADATPPIRKTDDTSDNVVAPIALPAPVQSTAAGSAATGSESAATASNTPSPAPTPGASNQPQTPSSAQTTPAPNGSTGTAGTSNGSAQSARGVALPPMASELGARVVLGAQALVSQPRQALATLPHGALQAAPTSAPTPTLAAAAHGATAPDPAAILPKLATSASLAAATPNTVATALESGAQPVSAQATAATAVAASTAELAVLASTADATAQPGADPALGAATAPVLVPLTPASAASTLESAPPPAIAASALDQVAASLKQTAKLGLNQIEIQLKPASLGAVDVRIELSHDGRITAVISADRSDTLMQLERNSGELQQALRDAGLQTDSGSLSFSLRGDPQTSDQSSRQPSYATQQGGPGSADDLLPVAAAAVGASQSPHSGLLNIQV